MIRRNTNNSSIILLSILFYSLLSVFWPGQSEDSALVNTIACIIHAILYILLAQNFSSYCKDPNFLKTPFAIGCLLLIAYLGVPFLKYFGRARYDEFDIGLDYRLLGLLAVCVSIAVILKLYARKWALFYRESHQSMRRSVGRLIGPLMYCMFGASAFFSIFGSIYLDLSVVQIVLITSGYFIPLYYFSLFGFHHATFLNELLLLSGALSITYFLGQRYAVLLAVVMLVFGRVSKIRAHQKRETMVLLSLVSIPLAAIMVLVPLTMVTKDRPVGIDFYFEIQRADFVDFVGAASEADYKENVAAGLYTSLLWAIPGGYIDKDKLDYSMEPFFANNRWRSSDSREGFTRNIIDYPDSIFSCGAMVGGLIGVILLPLAWFSVFSMVLSHFSKILLLSFYLASIPSMFNIEIAFWTIIPTLRNWVVTALILFFLFQLGAFLNYSSHKKARN